jgi:hypothetical protein
VDEVPLPALADIKQDAAISVPREVDLDVRPPVAVSLGPVLHGAAMPHPDPRDPLTTVAGSMKRFAIRPPKPDVQWLEELGEFVRDWLPKNLVPLDPATDVSVESWLLKTTYPRWRRDELLVKWYKVASIWEKRYHGVKSFMKLETYLEWKYARGINSRTDEFKCAVGPIFKAIEEKLYQHPSFIKHVPVADRPRYITEMLYREYGTYLASDYTAFEALFTKEVMEKVEFQLYEYMTSKLPGGPEFMRLVREVLGGLNWCEFRDFFVSLFGTRMSGEMCTSLGNGFANLMFMLFMLKKFGCTDVAGVVEGDDGLFVCRGTPPTGKDFEKLGLIIKLETYSSLAEASFCGMVFDPEDKLTVMDPREVLSAFGWASGNYARSNAKTLKTLLRCKSLSLAHQYPGCPVISALAQYGLRVTRDVKRIHLYRVMNSGKAMSGWERDQLLDALRDEARIKYVVPPMNTRLLVERLYGITVEMQYYFENLLDSKNDLLPIKDDLMLALCPQSWKDYWATYVGNAEDERRPHINAPQKCIILPCRRIGDWLVARDATPRNLPPVPGRLCDLTARAVLAR